MRKILSLLPCTTLVLAAACALGPNYKRPDVPAPEAYREPAPAGASVADVAWWDLFQDEQLKGLIRTALQENKDLKIAVARVQEARAALGFTKADQWPSITYVGQALRNRAFQGNALSALDPDSFAPFSSPLYNQYMVAADASFELDLWGRLRRSTESARAELLSTEGAEQTVRLTLISDVATTYLLLRDLDAQLQISKDTLKTRQESTQLVTVRYEKGIVSKLDVNQAKIQEANASAAIASFQRQVARTENALNLLLGHNPGPIPRGKSLEEQVFPPEVPVGLPSELLERRPDVLAAEQHLHARTAQIGVAQAMRFPTFSLTGTYGSESLELSKTVSGGAAVWNAGLNIVGPLFQAGKNKRRVEIEQARTEQALQLYEKTVQQAFVDVENALVAVRTFKDEHEAVVQSVAAARDARMLSQARYDAGLSSYLEVLDSERTLFLAELQASQTLQQRLSAVVALYKALGGGWQVEPAPAQQASAAPAPAAN